MLSSFFHVPCSNGSAEASISIHALIHHPQRLAMNEKTLSQRQNQLTLGMGMMLRSPANFKLLKFMQFPRFWTWFLFLAPLRPFSSLLPLPPCFIAFFLMAKLTYADLWWLFINSSWTPKHHEQSFPFSLQEHSKCSETYFRHNSSLWRCVQAFVRVYWQEVVFHGSNQERDDGGGGGELPSSWSCTLQNPTLHSWHACRLPPATHHPTPLFFFKGGKMSWEFKKG